MKVIISQTAMAKRFKHKFGAQACERDGIKFPSKLERSVYDALKLLEKAHKVRMVLRQPPFDLPGGFVHKVDFQVFTDEEVLFIEAKGRDLETGKLKRQQVEELYDIDIHVVRNVQDVYRLFSE